MRPIVIRPCVGDYKPSDQVYLVDFEVEVGDYVTYFASGGVGCGEVVRTIGLSKAQRDKAHVLAIGKVDIAGYKERAEKASEIREIKNKLHEMRTQHDDYQIYMQLAVSNPQIKALLTQLAELDDTVPKLP